jgi:hypothetical protein
LAAALLVSLSAAAAATRAPRPAPIALDRIVMAGDTLWEVVTDCGSATLRPGQALLLPIGERSVRDALRDPRGFAARAVRVAELDVAAALAGER